jgi:hypothetical protein
MDGAMSDSELVANALPKGDKTTTGKRRAAWVESIGEDLADIQVLLELACARMRDLEEDGKGANGLPGFLQKKRKELDLLRQQITEEARDVATKLAGRVQIDEFVDDALAEEAIIEAMEAKS